MKNEYKHWKVVGGQVTNKFKVVAIETFGVVIKSDILSIFTPFINARENQAQVLNLVIQQVSVAIHTIRANQFNTISRNHVLRHPPIHPLRNRANSPVLTE